MSVLVPTFGLWSDRDAVLWPERSHPPAYLSGAAFQVWEPVVLRGVDPDDLVTPAGLEATRRVLAGLRQRGLLDESPAPLRAATLDDEVVVVLTGVDVPVAVARGDRDGWPDATPAEGPPVLRVRPAPDGGGVVTNARNGLPVALCAGPAAVRDTLMAAGHGLAHPTADHLSIPLEPWRRDGEIVLISPVLVTDPAVRAGCARAGFAPADGPVARLAGFAPRVDDEPVAGLVLDASWTAANPEGGPLALHWLLACLLAATNPATAAGRYALLDTAARLARDRSVAWAGAATADRVPALLARLPVAAP